MSFRPRSKYGAVKTTVDGIVFDSAKEARRYSELKLLEKAGEIHGLRLQPRYELLVKDVMLGEYRADFVYCRFIDRKRENGETIVEDVKGFKTPLYRWKKRHVEAQYGIEIREI